MSRRSPLVPALALAGALLAGAPLPARAAAAPAAGHIQWSDGPATGRLGDVATLDVPAGYAFTDRAGALRVMELTQNPTSGAELGILAPKADSSRWFAIFEFRRIGYVKDAAREKLDAVAILASLRKGNEEANAERRKRHWTTVDIVDWSVPPRYDPASHNLEWGVDAVTRPDSGASASVSNYSIRVLGREGVMNCEVVGPPTQMPAALAAFRTAMAGFRFAPGRSYAEFRPGDKIAAVGLTGLIVGGAAVAAAKSGLLAKFFKPLIVVLAGAFAAIGRFFKRIVAKLLGREDAGGA